MSTLNVDAIVSSSGGNTTTVNGKLPLPNTSRNARNIIINGDMNIAQRATSSTGLGGTSGYYTADRWEHQFNGTSGRLTSSVVGITDLAGLRSALKFACTTADTSIATTEYFVLAHKMEGFNIQSVGFGTADAKPLTLSFYAKGNGNATYTAQLQTGGSNEVSASFNVTSSWQRFEINYPAATNVGSVLNNDNNAQLSLQIWLVSGATYSGGSSLNTTWGSPNNNTMAVGNDNFFSSTSNEFFITGVQLEVGSVATDFEYRPIGEELALCQRYFYNCAPARSGQAEHHIMTGAMYDANYCYGKIEFPVTMRTMPTIVQTSGSQYFQIYCAGASNAIDSLTMLGSGNSNENFAMLRNTQAVSFTAGQAANLQKKSASAALAFDAEL